MQQIAELEQKQDWAGLASLAEQRRQQVPGSPDWQVIYGYAQIRLKAYPRAIDALSHAVERNPEDMDGWNLLGEALRLDGQQARAIQVLERAASISPSAPATHYLLGELYREIGRNDRAIRSYRDAVRLEENLAPAWFGLGVALGKTGQAAELERVMKRLEALDPPLARELAGIQARNK